MPVPGGIVEPIRDRYRERLESERKAAPMRMKAIMQEVRTAPIRLSVKVLHESDPCPAASTNDPITPIAAASVAVA